jgi:hypothetical protein
MSLSLKEIINSVLSESGFLEKPTYTGSSDIDDRQMVSIANRVASDTIEWCQWSGNIEQAEIVMTEATVYPLPEALLSIVPDSMWEADGSRPVMMPTPESRWYMYKFSTLSDAGIIRARISGTNIEIYAPEPGEKILYAYLTKFPI